jgi:hypothetical protein
VLVPVEEGALRLDTRTGDVSLCAADGAGACKPVPDAARDDTATIAGLEARLSALEARIAGLEARDPVARLSDEQSMDRVAVLADRMMRNFVKMVREMKKDAESGDL